jgi:hypothetical protein
MFPHLFRKINHIVVQPHALILCLYQADTMQPKQFYAGLSGKLKTADAQPLGNFRLATKHI